MGRPRKEKMESTDNSEVRVAIAKPMKKEDKKIKLIDFARALRTYRKSNVDRAVFMQDTEAIKAWAVKKVPSLQASAKDWDELLKKF